jgi:hypothetical protein
LAKKKERNFTRNIIFSYSNRPNKTKFDAGLKTGLKQFHAISKGYDFCDWNFGGNDPTKF